MKDPFTFGNTKAAVSLAKILDEVKTTKKVSLTIHRWQRLFKSLTSIADKSHKQFLANLVLNHFKNTISKLKVEDKIKSHSNNLLAANYRELVK